MAPSAENEGGRNTTSAIKSMVSGGKRAEAGLYLRLPLLGDSIDDRAGHLGGHRAKNTAVSVENWAESRETYAESKPAACSGSSALCAFRTFLRSAWASSLKPALADGKPPEAAGNTYTVPAGARVHTA